MNSKKIKKKVFISVLIVFVLWSLFWFFNVYLRYKPFCDSIGYNSELKGYYYGDENRRNYAVFRPSFFIPFGGNLSISDPYREQEDGTILPDPHLVMLIYPEPFGKYTAVFGLNCNLRIKISEQDEYTTASEIASDYFTYHLEKTSKDDSWRIVDIDGDEDGKLYEQYKPEIDKFLEDVYDVFKIAKTMSR